jgi:pantetheine-phosphate adenylyltransferase
MKICLFPGTFDPITLGHVDLIERSAPLFDKIIIGIGKNSSKQPMFTIEQRIAWIQKVFEDNAKIEVQVYEGLTVNFCKEINAKFILRGIRYVSDFEYEKAIADMNSLLDDNIETIFLTCSTKFSSFSSTLVREVFKHGGDVTNFIPSSIQLKKI